MFVLEVKEFDKVKRKQFYIFKEKKEIVNIFYDNKWS